MDRILFGDNQFFGVNHMSEAKAREQQIRFSTVESIMDVLEQAYEQGVHTFMCTTHDRIAEVADRVRRSPGRFPEFTFFPGMPYAHKYATAVTEDGLLGALRRFTPSSGMLDAAVRGTRSIVSKDVEGLITLLIDSEMKMFEGLSTPVVFLQNVMVDLLLGLGFDDAFLIFDEHVRRRYGAQPGYFTMNLELLLNRLEAIGIVNPIICTNLNKIGFRMSGGVASYQRVLAEREFQAIAMSVFASGAIRAEEAIEWICQQPNVKSIVFGASSGRNIASTVELVQRYWPDACKPALRPGSAAS